MYRNDEAASRPNGRAFMSQDPSYLILQEERMRLQKELMKAKENLTIVVQEMIHTEDQLKKKELEVSDLKQRLSNIREETSKNVNTLHQTQKIIDIKDSALLSQSMKEERYLQTITEQKEKIDELQLQISSLNQTNQHLQSQIDQQSEKHDKLNRVLQKENYELKQRLTEIKVKLQKEEVKRTTDMKKIVEERNALQDEIKSLLASDLTRQEKMLLIQSSPFIFSKDPKEREGDDNFNDRLNHSLVVSNTLKLLSSSKERVKSLENENSALKQALLDFGQEAEKEKAVLIKQISNMQKTILELTKQTTSSLEMANGADLKQHEIDSLRMENDQLRMQLVKFETHFSLENERTALEKESSRLDQIMSIPIEMAPQAPIDTDVPVSEIQSIATNNPDRLRKWQCSCNMSVTYDTNWN